MDLQNLPANAVERRGGTVYIRVPEPSRLSCEVPEKDLEVISSTTALRKLYDNAVGADSIRDMRLLIEKQADAFLRENNAVPTREQLVHRLNGYAAMLEKRVGLPVVFE